MKSIERKVKLRLKSNLTTTGWGRINDILNEKRKRIDYSSKQNIGSVDKIVDEFFSSFRCE